MANLALYVNKIPGDDTGPTAGDAAMRTHLISFGHTVTYVDDAVTPTLAQGFDGYVMSESCTGVIDAVAFAALALPWLSCDIGSFDDMLMASVANGANLGSSRFFDLSAHDITAGLTLNDCQVRNQNVGFWGTPGGAANLAPGAVIFAVHRDDATETMGFAVDAGGTLVGGGTAPARRVCIAYIDSFIDNGTGGVLTAEGITLIEQAVDWMLVSTGTPATVTPGTVALPLDVPACTAHAASTLTAPTPTVAIGAPAPTVRAASTLPPATAVLPIDVPAPSTGVAETVIPTAVALLVDVPAPTVHAASTLTGATPLVLVDTPQPVVRGRTTVAPAAAVVLLEVPAPDVIGAEPERVDITVAIGPPRMGSAAIADTRMGSVQVGDSRNGSVVIAAGRAGTLTVAEARMGSADVGDTRMGSVDVGDTRTGTVAVAEPRIERGP